MKNYNTVGTVIVLSFGHLSWDPFRKDNTVIIIYK